MGANPVQCDVCGALYHPDMEHHMCDEYRSRMDTVEAEIKRFIEEYIAHRNAPQDEKPE